jgi:hypothetical protein
LIIEVPEAEQAVGALRLLHIPSASLGAPAHITVLFPFLPPEAIDEAAVAEVVGAHAAFDYELTGVATFPEGATYLTPVPAEPFVELTRAVAAQWPDHPPYEGAHETVVPHLTVSIRTPVDVRARFPIRARADAVSLIEEGDDDRWRIRAAFLLGRGEPGSSARLPSSPS